MMGAYEGKRAVVIGGTHGMGLGVVEDLLAGGARVLLTGRNEKNLEELRGRFGPDVHVVRADATSIAESDALAETVRERLGGIDFLHVNVGTSELAPFDEVSEESYDRMFAVNTKGAYFTVQRLLPLIEDHGSIVFTTAVTNVMASASMGVYAGTKAAVLAFSRTLASELLPRGIRVNTVAPGPVDTPMAARTPASVRKAMEATGAIGYATAEQLADNICYLASPGAAHVVGAVLLSNGGRFTVS
jgi:NAD(P)-dependent dehydrogenase (short-subunit alcohol dehydrogenase family)